jgi:tetratricopeptide (TPR) repeat protein
MIQKLNCKDSLVRNNNFSNSPYGPFLAIVHRFCQPIWKYNFHVVLVVFWLLFLTKTTYAKGQVATGKDSLRVTELIEASSLSTAKKQQEAIKLASEAVAIAMPLNDFELLMVSLRHLGKLHMNYGNYSEATKIFIQMINSSKQEDRKEWLARGYYHLGSIELILEDYKDALKNYELSKRYFLDHYGAEEQIPILDRLGFYNNYAVLYAGIGELPDAIQAIDKGLQLSSLHKGFVINRIQLLNNKGDLLIKMGEIELAIDHYLQASELFPFESNPLFEAMIDNSLGKAYLVLGDFDKAVSFFNQGLVLASGVRGYSHLKHLSEGLSKAFELNGQLDSAYFYLQMSLVYKDSLNIQSTTEQLVANEVEQKFATELSGVKDFYEKNKLEFQFIILLLLLIVAYFLFKSWQRKLLLNQSRIEQQHLSQEKESLITQNSELQEKISHSQKELTLVSIANIQKNQTLVELSESLMKNRTDGNLLLDEDLGKLLKKLSLEHSEANLRDFEYRFSHVYIGFFESLMEVHPTLTLNERRLAAFLKLQLTTKEIASITGQSVRALEIARTRLRKKIGLTKSDLSLYDYFLAFPS